MLTSGLGTPILGKNYNLALSCKEIKIIDIINKQVYHSLKTLFSQERVAVTDPRSLSLSSKFCSAALSILVMLCELAQAHKQYPTHLTN